MELIIFTTLLKYGLQQLAIAKEMYAPFSERLELISGYRNHCSQLLTAL